MSAKGSYLKGILQDATVASKVSRLSTAHVWFALSIAAGAVLFWPAMSAVAHLAATVDYCSHIPLIPLLTAYLLWDNRRQIFTQQRYSRSGAYVIAAALSLYVVGITRYAPSVSCQAAALVIYCVGAFILCYGIPAWRTAWGRLLFLVLAIPLPTSVLDYVVNKLQQGSAAISYALLQATGMPVFPDGLVLYLPGSSIQVAPECSGIRSSIALAVVSVFASHLLLRTSWKKVVLVLPVLPLMVLKNGVRIATLSWLSIHVSPSFLTGRLHHEGGFIFFGIGVLLWLPFLWWLRRSEQADHGNILTSTKS